MRKGPILLSLLATILLIGCAQSITDESGANEIEQNTSSMDEHTADSTLRAYLGGIKFFHNADIARIPELDVEGYFCFYVSPESSGRSAALTFMVGENTLLSSGQDSDFDTLVMRLHDDGIKLEVEQFGGLFIRMKARRNGLILHTWNEHPLLKPEDLPEDQFSPPTLEQSDKGLHYSFWFFDTDRYEPFHYHLFVDTKGTFRFSE